MNMNVVTLTLLITYLEVIQSVAISTEQEKYEIKTKIKQIADNVFEFKDNIQIISIPSVTLDNVLGSSVVQGLDVPVTIGNDHNPTASGYVMILNQSVAVDLLPGFCLGYKFKAQRTLLLVIDTGSGVGVTSESEDPVISTDTDIFHRMVNLKGVDIVVVQILHVSLQTDHWNWNRNIQRGIVIMAYSLRKGTSPNVKLPRWQADFTRYLPRMQMQIQIFDCRPFIYMNMPSPFGPHSGIEKYLMDYLKQATGWPIKLMYNIAVSDVQFALLDRLSDVNEGALCAQFDAITGVLNAEMTYPYTQVCYTFLVHKPKLLPYATFVFQPLQITVWLMLVLFIFIASLPYYAQNGDEMLALVRLYQLQVGGSNARFPRPLVLRLVVMTCLVGAILSNAYYTASYSSIFTNPRYEAPIRTVDDMIARKIGICEIGTGVANALNLTASGHLTELVAHFKSFKRLPARNEVLRDGQHAIVAYRFPHEFLGRVEYLDDYGKKNMMVLDDCFGEFHVSLALRRGSAFKDRFDLHIQRAVEFGLVEKFTFITQMDNWKVNREMSSYFTVYSEESEAVRPLRMELLVGAFYMLIGGWVLGWVTIGIELFISNKQALCTM